MPFPYKTVLVTGATSGIGLGLTERLIEHGCFVIAVGRRKERLDALVAKHGTDKVATEVHDVSDLSSLEAWVKKLTTAHPSLDSIILNAGLQQTVDFTAPTTISLPQLTYEMQTNYLSPLHTALLFLPHLLSLAPRPVSIVLVSSGLALVPIARCANYCATKAAIHSLAWTLRSQLADPAFAGGRHVRVVEIVPPAVQTELHSSQTALARIGQGHFGMPLGEYVDETWASLSGEAEVDEILTEAHKERIGGVETEKRRVFGQMEGMMRKMGSKA